MPPGTLRSQYRAVVTWLTRYTPPVDASNLVLVRNYLEAFHHLCQMKKWKSAFKILDIRAAGSTSLKLDEQLRLWGYYQELIGLYTKIIGLTPQYDLLLFGLLGTIYGLVGKTEDALESDLKSLAIARQFQDKKVEVLPLMAVGSDYAELGEYQTAKEILQESLRFAQDTEETNSEGLILKMLGNVYADMKDFRNALTWIG